MSDRHAQAYRCLQDGSRGFAACTSSVCGCPSRAMAVPELSPKTFWVVQCWDHPTWGVACSGPLTRQRRAVGATWVWFVGRLLLWRGFACGRRWGCGTHRGLVEVKVVVGAAPGGVGGWVGLLSDVAGCLRRTVCSPSAVPGVPPARRVAHDVHCANHSANISCT